MLFALSETENWNLVCKLALSWTHCTVLPLVWNCLLKNKNSTILLAWYFLFEVWGVNSTFQKFKDLNLRDACDFWYKEKWISLLFQPRLADTRRAAIHCADMDLEYYRLRSFSITSHGVCNLGDSMRLDLNLFLYFANFFVVFYYYNFVSYNKLNFRNIHDV